MPRTRPPYSPGFSRETIRLVRASDEEHPIPKIATELGVAAETSSNRVGARRGRSTTRPGRTVVGRLTSGGRRDAKIGVLAILDHRRQVLKVWV